MKRPCDHCSTPYEAKTGKSKFCSTACRQKHHRAGGGRPSAAVVRPDSESGETTRDAVLAALITRELQSTPQGRAALVLADRLDHPARETGAGLAAVARQMDAMLDKMLRIQTADAPDLFDELEARRERRITGN